MVPYWLKCRRKVNKKRRFAKCLLFKRISSRFSANNSFTFGPYTDGKVVQGLTVIRPYPSVSFYCFSLSFVNSNFVFVLFCLQGEIFSGICQVDCVSNSWVSYMPGFITAVVWRDYRVLSELQVSSKFIIAYQEIRCYVLLQIMSGKLFGWSWLCYLQIHNVLLLFLAFQLWKFL